MSSAERYRLGVMVYRLDEAIRAELARRIPDLIRLRRLKRLSRAVQGLLTSGTSSSPAVPV